MVILDKLFRQCTITSNGVTKKISFSAINDSIVISGRKDDKQKRWKLPFYLQPKINGVAFMIFLVSYGTINFFIPSEAFVELYTLPYKKNIHQNFRMISVPSKTTRGQHLLSQQLQSNDDGTRNVFHDYTNPTTKVKQLSNNNTARTGFSSVVVMHWIGTVTLMFSLSMFGIVPPATCALETMSTNVNTVTLNNAGSSSTSSTLATNNYNYRGYWTIQNDGTDDERRMANIALMDHIVGTINTMYYDRTAGKEFTPAEYYSKWRSWYKNDPSKVSQMLSTREGTVTAINKVLIQNLPDHFAKYLTREDLYLELSARNDGFVGIGAIVEVPGSNPFIEDAGSTKSTTTTETTFQQIKPFTTKPARWKVTDSLSFVRYISNESKKKSNHPSAHYMTQESLQNVPVITAVIPFSPAERAGLTVGDRIIAVQDDSFLMVSRNQVATKLMERYSPETNQYFGYSELTIAKPVQVMETRATIAKQGEKFKTQDFSIPIANKYENEYPVDSKIVEVFRPTRVRLPTVLASTKMESFIQQHQESYLTHQSDKVVSSPLTQPLSGYNRQESIIPSFRGAVESVGSNNMVRWNMINSVCQGSIFFGKTSVAVMQEQEHIDKDNIQRMISLNENKDVLQVEMDNDSIRSITVDTTTDESVVGGVGYIRLTRFSRTSVEGFFQAVKELEDAGANSYIIDLRNNYGGVIQSAMMLASTLLRDPHDVLCYTMNSRGGFTPHDVEEYVVDKYYPGYLLSSEPWDATIKQVREENPSFLEDTGWSPPSSYASLREQSLKRGIRKISRFSSHRIDPMMAATTMKKDQDTTTLSPLELIRMRQKDEQKPIVLLINEGTASAAEVFASALRENGRTVALVGAKTYGKGLIQHTFPLPDGGALRLTVAEYLTPSLQHVSRIGRAQYDPVSNKWVGGGILPDVYCDSKHGIPSNVGADLCVATALDVLREYEQTITTAPALDGIEIPDSTDENYM